MGRDDGSKDKHVYKCIEFDDTQKQLGLTLKPYTVTTRTTTTITFTKV